MPPRFHTSVKAVGWVALALVGVGTWQGGWTGQHSPEPQPHPT